MIFGDPRIPDRIWSKILVAPNGCWIWMGAFSHAPQVRWKVDGHHKTVNVRRVLFELDRGPAGEAIGAECTLRCVRPEHVYAGSHREVCVRSSRARHGDPAQRTTCRRGHLLADVGVYRRTIGGRKVRSCRECWALKEKTKRDKRYMRRLARMSPERRATYIRRAAAQRAAWRDGRRRRPDGTLAVTARLSEAR